MFDQSKDAIDRYKATHDGADKAVVALNEDLNRQLRNLNEQKSVWEEIRGIIDDMKSPIEKLSDEMVFLESNFDKLGSDTYYKKIASLGQSFLGSIGPAAAPSNAAAQAGSAEANRAIYEFTMQNQSVQERIAGLLTSIDAKMAAEIQTGKAIEQAVKERDRPITASIP